MATVVGRFIFYPGSYWGETIAPDKAALRPHQTAAFANYISYHLGIRGLFVDVEDLAAPGAVSAADFLFTQGNDDRPVYWPAANPPDAVTVTPGGGVGGSDRIKLTWNASACENSRWLEVTLKANANTGLATEDVHYWGLAIGETGNSASDAMVTAEDVDDIRNHLFEWADVDNRWDMDRSGRVLANDWKLAGANLTDEETCLKLITPTLWRFTGRPVAGQVVAIGQVAGEVHAIGHGAGDVVVIGQGAGEVQAVRHAAGEVVVIGQAAGQVG